MAEVCPPPIRYSAFDPFHVSTQTAFNGIAVASSGLRILSSAASPSPLPGAVSNIFSRHPRLALTGICATWALAIFSASFHHFREYYKGTQNLGTAIGLAAKDSLWVPLFAGLVSSFPLMFVENFAERRAMAAGRKAYTAATLMAGAIFLGLNYFFFIDNEPATPPPSGVYCHALPVTM